MFWIRKYLYIVFISFFFSGCSILLADAVILYIIPGTDKNKKIYLELVDNDKFKYFLVEREIINNLSMNDTIYVDNASSYANLKEGNTKILLTYNSIYFIKTKVNRLIKESLNKYNYKEFDYDITEYKYSKYNINTLYEYGDMLDYNILTLVVSPIEKRWYLAESFDITVILRYNNIQKIKEIIDERVDFHKKNKAYEKIK